MLARGITGLAACGRVAITVMYSAFFPPAQAARAIAGLGLTNGLGQVIATYSGGVVADVWGWRAPFVLSLGVGAVGVGLMSLCRERQPGSRSTGSLTLRRMWEVGTSPTLLLVSGLSALNTYANFTTVFGFIPVYARDLGASRGELGLLTAISLVPFTVAQPLGARLTERIGFRTTVYGGLLVSGLATVATPLAQTFWVLVALQVVSGLGRGLMSASLMSLAILSVEQSERATAMGVYQAVYSIGMFLGPLIGGVIGEHAGLGAVFVSTGLLTCGAAAVARLTLQPRYATLSGG